MAAFFTALPAEAFDRRKAAHLLRRAGFGPTREEIDAALEQGLEGAVDALLAPNDEDEAEFQSVYAAVAGSLMNFQEVGPAQAWWVHRMVRSRSPLAEKMALFWHGHFATNVNKVGDTRLMQMQVDGFRRLGLGDFRELVVAVAQDPAMLVYLDGESNTQAHPNENFARELMELFTCGIGAYTEQDVLEGARAFTGWHREGAAFAFHPDDHDGGRKRFLGRTGAFDGYDCIDMLMQHPATPRFIGAKLLRFFAAAEPSPEALDEAGMLFDRTQLNVKWFLRELFVSEYFYSDACYRRRIASPAEYVVGTVRSLGVRMPAADMANQMAAMGQELFAPPNVKGWDGEQKWINSSRWPARLAFAENIAGLNSDDDFGPHLPLDLAVPADLTEPDQVVEALSQATTQGDLSDEVRQSLGEFLVSTDEGPKPERFREDADFRSEMVRGALATILSLPEYHAW